MNKDKPKNSPEPQCMHCSFYEPAYYLGIGVGACTEGRCLQTPQRIVKGIMYACDNFHSALNGAEASKPEVPRPEEHPETADELFYGAQKPVFESADLAFHRMKREEALAGTAFAQGATDPTGRSAHEPGAKLDAGKNRMGLVLAGFAKALMEMCKVGTFGANKYTPEGWKSVPEPKERYMNALMRHVFAYMHGEIKDPETGLSHLAHAAWNVLALLSFDLKEDK